MKLGTSSYLKLTFLEPVIKSSKFTTINYENREILFISRSHILYNSLIQRPQEADVSFC